MDKENMTNGEKQAFRAGSREEREKILHYLRRYSKDIAAEEEPLYNYIEEFIMGRKNRTGKRPGGAGRK